MKKALIYIHGMGGSGAEADRLKPVLPDYDIYGPDFADFTPWGTFNGIYKLYDALSMQYEKVVLLGNSIGCWFLMNALGSLMPKRALFISPVTDMERMILSMMAAEGVTEETLEKRRLIKTASGAVLSWDYLAYVREHLVDWKTKTSVLYAGGDALIPRSEVETFAALHGADLTVMENGEHWFHTPEQLAFLDAWLKKNL